jgi:hypothetical protein
MAKNTTLAWASFPTREEAEQARIRLEENGFARNSIDLDRRDDGSYTVEVHTREENLPHVEELLHTSASMYAARRFTSNLITTATANPLVVAGAAALGALVIYNLLPRNRRPTVYSIREFPSRMRETMRDLPETAREAMQTVQQAARDLPGAVTETVSGLAGASQEQSSQQSRQH